MKGMSSDIYMHTSCYLRLSIGTCLQRITLDASNSVPCRPATNNISNSRSNTKGQQPGMSTGWCRLHSRGTYMYEITKKFYQLCNCGDKG